MIRSARNKRWTGSNCIAILLLLHSVFVLDDASCAFSFAFIPPQRTVSVVSKDFYRSRYEGRNCPWLYLREGLSGFRELFDNSQKKVVGKQGELEVRVKTVGEETIPDSDVEKGKSRVRDIRFVSPLLEYGYPPAVEEYNANKHTKKPLLVYLPGFDSTFLCPFLQFPELGTEFEVQCLTTSIHDRSTFDELKQDVIEFIIKELKEPLEIDDKAKEMQRKDKTKETATKTELVTTTVISNLFKFNNSKEPSKRKRPFYLVGESFGGLLAAEVALCLLQDFNIEINLEGLVLINSATCYDRCRLASEGEPVTNVPKPLYIFSLSKLLPLFLDKYSFQQLLLIFRGEGLPSVIDTPAREAYMGRVAFSLPKVLQFMPQETLRWRLQQWLSIGCAKMEPKLTDFAKKYPSFRVLIIAGENDLALPSIAEAERLAQILPNSHVHVVEGAGHASTCGSRLDLTAVMRFWFKELSVNATMDENQGSSPLRRTAMKKVAAQGDGIYFGLEPRYDGKNIGLNPLLYWSKELYQAPGE